MDTPQQLKAQLKGKVVILGIGNILRGDDAAGSLLAGRIKDKIPYTVYDAGISPENFLGKIVKDRPDKIIIVDAVDSGAKTGEIRMTEPGEIRGENLFFTHNASLSMVINYLQSNLKADIIILTIQPGNIGLTDKLSPEIEQALGRLEGWFLEAAD